MNEDSLAMALIAAQTPPDDIQQAVIDWVGECPYIDPNAQILTDLLDPGAPPGYAVAATGSVPLRRYIRRGSDWQNTYALYARFLGKENRQRQRNARFLQNFMDWAERRAQRKDFFKIPHGQVRGIEASNGMLFDSDESGNMIYQVQLKLSYYREV